MNEDEFGGTIEYVRAFDAVRAEGIPDKHLALLRAHFSEANHATTWAMLAEIVEYPNGNSVNLQYGKFAERIARQLGLRDKPLDSDGTPWWLWVLVRWADDRHPETGHTVFVLRRPVVEAIQQLQLFAIT